LRGFRIELGEIEAALEKHPAIKQPVVLVWDGGAGDKRLVAYLVYQPGETLTGSELRKFLRGDLPDYMIPQLFVEMAELPLTANNKVDRRALPDPLKRTSGDDDPFVAPTSDNEKLVAAVWKDVLQLSRQVGLYDNFFDLGGHSLLSAQVTYRVEKATGHRLSPRALVFQNVAQLAAELPIVNSDEGLAAAGVESGAGDVAAAPAEAPNEASRGGKAEPAPSKAKALGGWLLNKVKKRLF
ncbi:MAG TPA: non-ribosomal peptide synthetase, partial [Sorangium sp.]|nr:non-ribosomal peptide synthetase [Sorangium sp.]